VSDERKPTVQRITETHKPALGPVDQVHRAVVPRDDIETHSYKPPTGPVDQVKPREPASPANSTTKNK